MINANIAELFVYRDVDYDIDRYFYSRVDIGIYFEVEKYGYELFELKFVGEVYSYIDSSVNKYVKYEVDVHIDGSVDLDLDRNFGAEVGKGENKRVESGVGDEVVSGYGEGVELEVADVVVYRELK